jgi:hypothetical protein
MSESAPEEGLEEQKKTDTKLDEEWKHIETIEVSSLAHFRDPATGRTINTFSFCHGRYNRVGFKTRCFLVSTLVCRAFHGEPPEKNSVVHHIGSTTDDRASNLEWSTRSAVVKARPATKYEKPVWQLSLDGERIKLFSSQKEAAKALKLKRNTISMATTGKRKTAGGYRFEWAEDKRDFSKLPNERWKSIARFRHYQVSNKGRIRVKKNSLILAATRRADGYVKVALSLKGKTYPRFVHRLVVAAFIREMKTGEQVDHVDGIKWHNDLSNLRICTRKQNMQYFRDQKKAKTSASREEQEDVNANMELDESSS